MTMKTITAKEFQLQHSAILKEVAKGNEYEVTFHRKPLVKLVPVTKISKKPLAPGSRAALLESFKHTVKSTGELRNVTYKQLRARMLDNKYGK